MEVVLESKPMVFATEQSRNLAQLKAHLVKQRCDEAMIGEVEGIVTANGHERRIV